MGQSTVGRTAAAACALAVCLTPSAALAHERAVPERDREDVAPYLKSLPESPAERSLRGRSSFSGQRQHDGSNAHLPATRENVDLVGKLEPTLKFNNIVAGQIADVAVYKSTAYLASRSEDCARGGTFVADISDPAQPREIGFIPAPANSFPGEGEQVLTVNTPEFSGDVLAVNNEDDNCPGSGQGGFNLYDVSDPRQPKVLVEGAGDRGPDDGSLDGSAPKANSAHSIFMWEAGGKVYLVAVDNVELHDVDIFDISNPRGPRPVGEFDLIEEAFEEGKDIYDNGALGDSPFLHDMVVKKIGDTQTMLASYWDAGYVTLDVNDPSDPKIIGDTTFDGADPLTGFTPPEGNAHQAEFSADNRFILAGDEDFAPYRTETLTITSGTSEGQDFAAAEVGGGTSPKALEDGKLNGPVVYGGYGCDGSAPIPPRSSSLPATLGEGEEAIVVLSRGPAFDTDEDYDGDGDTDNDSDDACFPGDKGSNAAAAGYDAMLLVNRHTPDGAAGDSAFCGTGGFTEDVVTLCTTHEAFHLMFNDEPTYEIPYDDSDGTSPDEGPGLGQTGERVQAIPVFDSWGYAHVYENSGAKLREIEAYAIREALNPAFSFDYGDLSVHEFATDPAVNVAYTSYYSGGLRVFTFGEGGMTEQGRYIDQGGNNFWGVEQFTAANGERLIAASDRDFGLYLFRYTGPGAVGPSPAGPGAPPVPAALQSTGCANQIAGTAARDLIAGTEGSDTVRAAAGDDIVDARAGDDCLFGEAGQDVIDGEAGNDRIEGATGGDRLIGSDGTDMLLGAGGGDRLSGGDGRDHLSGGAKRDVLAGGDNADKLYGGTGNDQVSGGRGADRISGGTASDRIYGNAGADRITPGKGRDRVIAAGGNDRIFARDGRKDRISCGSGRDTVSADRNDVLSSCERVSRR